MPRAEDKRRDALAKVPNIYGTLPVVALLPGSLCKCLKEAVEEHKKAQLVERTEFQWSVRNENIHPAELNLESRVNGYRCLNSKKFSVLRVNEETAASFDPASEPEGSVDQLSDYLHCAYNQATRAQGLGHSEALAQLAAFNKDFILTLIAQGMGGGKDGSLFTRIANLLLGKLIMTGDLIPYNGGFPIVIFHVLAFSGRKVTKEVDYVLSTLISWKDYHIPVDHHIRTAKELLELALKQHYQKDSVIILSSSPAGLLGARSGTAI